jgi:hypothetical protein
VERRILSTGSLLIGLLGVGAFFGAVANDPCGPGNGNSTGFLTVGSISLGAVAYLVADRRNSRAWIPVAALIATAVGAFFVSAMAAYIVLWYPSCTS